MKEQLFFDMETYTKEELPPQKTFGKARLKNPQRDQVCFKQETLDDIIPENHRVRKVWDFINKVDFSSFIEKIQAVEGSVGRPATAPSLLFAIWIYGIIEGIGSARTLSRYCEEHNAFIWLCGGVKINYHTLSDFRSNSPEEMDSLLSQTVASLVHSEIVSLERISQDGMRVRAHASGSSFRRKPKLMKLMKIANKRIKELNKELKEDSSKYSLRQKSAKERAAREGKEKVANALSAMKEIKKKLQIMKLGEVRKK